MALTPDAIRAARAEDPKARDRDLADRLGIREAHLVASHCGVGAVRIDAHPDRIIPAAATLGEVMALTRNDACVHEKVGQYRNYTPGEHAAMVVADESTSRRVNRWRGRGPTRTRPTSCERSGRG